MHIANRFRQLIIMLVAMSFSSQFALGKRPAPLKLIEQVPVIDTAIYAGSSPFEIGIKQTTILSPPNSATLLQARLRDMRARELRLRERHLRELHLRELQLLKAKTDNSVLRGRVSETEKHLRELQLLKAKTDNSALRGQVTQAEAHLRELRLQTAKTDSVLHGRATADTRLSVIETFEYGVTPQFYPDLFQLMPETAPDLTQQMHAQLDQSKLRLADQVAQAEKLMKQQLSALPRQAPLMPVVAPTTVAPDLSKQLKQKLALAEKQPQMRIPPIAGPSTVNQSQQIKSELAQAKQSQPGHMPQMGGSSGGAGDLSQQIKLQLGRSQQAERAQIESGKQQMEQALTQARQNTPTMASSTGTALRLQIPNTAVNAALRLPPVDAQKQMEAQLVAAKLQLPPNTEVAAKLLQAEKQSDALAARALPRIEPNVKAVLLPADSQKRPGHDESTTVEIVADAVIPWDAWHARFAKVASAPLLNCVSNCSNPRGANTVSITVQRNHHIGVTLVKRSNPAFDEAVLKAYRSLDGNAALEYPAGSKRKTVTFLINNTHGETAIPSGVNSKTSVGDKELQRNSHRAPNH